jgi:hypothetical protein
MLRIVKARCDKRDQDCDAVQLILAAAGAAAQKIGKGAGFSVKQIRAYRLCSGKRKRLTRQAQAHQNRAVRMLVRAWKRQRQQESRIREKREKRQRRRRKQQARIREAHSLQTSFTAAHRLNMNTTNSDGDILHNGGNKEDVSFNGTLVPMPGDSTVVTKRKNHDLRQQLDKAVSSRRLRNTQRMAEASTGVMEGFRCLYAGASCSGLLFRAAGSDNAQASGPALEVRSANQTPSAITDASAREACRCLFSQTDRRRLV